MQGRIRAFDWLRGVAVFFMIQCHALCLVGGARRESALMHWLLWFDGLVAPSFIFSAGFSLALVQIRGAAAGNRARRIRKTLRRLFEVLFVASLINSVWFPVWREPIWFLRIDILHCIGLSLLIALPLLAWLAPRPRLLGGVAFALALTVFAVSPFAEAVRGPWARLLNGSRDSVFPLVPWAGYVYLGASAGAVAATGNIRALVKWLGVLLGAGVALRLCQPLFLRWYPPHTFWVTDPAEHGRRWAIVCGFVLSLLFLESRAAERVHASRVGRFVELFGTSSLAAYFFHQMLLFRGLFGYSFDGIWHERCGWAKYGVLTAIVIALTAVLTWVTDKIYTRVNAWLEGPKPPVGAAQPSRS